MTEYPTTFKDLRVYLAQKLGPSKPIPRRYPMSDAEWDRLYHPEAVAHREMVAAIRENTEAIHRMADLLEHGDQPPTRVPRDVQPRPTAPSVGNKGSQL